MKKKNSLLALFHRLNFDTMSFQCKFCNHAPYKGASGLWYHIKTNHKEINNKKRKKNINSTKKIKKLKKKNKNKIDHSARTNPNTPRCNKKGEDDFSKFINLEKWNIKSEDINVFENYNLITNNHNND